jgi:hypothetical protein
MGEYELFGRQLVPDHECPLRANSGNSLIECYGMCFQYVDVNASRIEGTAARERDSVIH